MRPPRPLKSAPLRVSGPPPAPLGLFQGSHKSLRTSRRPLRAFSAKLSSCSSSWRSACVERSCTSRLTMPGPPPRHVDRPQRLRARGRLRPKEPGRQAPAADLDPISTQNQPEAWQLPQATTAVAATASLSSWTTRPLKARASPPKPPLPTPSSRLREGKTSRIGSFGPLAATGRHKLQAPAASLLAPGYSDASATMPRSDRHDLPMETAACWVPCEGLHYWQL